MEYGVVCRCEEGPGKGKRFKTQLVIYVKRYALWIADGKDVIRGPLVRQ